MRYIIVIIFLSFAFAGYAQHKTKTDTTVYNAVEVEPIPPGGDAGLNKHLSMNLRFKGTGEYPTDEQGNIEMSFTVKFIVEKDGSLSHFTRLKGSAQNCNEMIRVLKTMPKWKPGMMKGKPVRTWFLLPLNL